MSTFGTNLECIMQEMKISQFDLAERSGLTPSAISYFINGKREPSVGSLLSICVALNLTPNDVLGFHSPKKVKTETEITKLRAKINRAMEILEL